MRQERRLADMKELDIARIRERLSRVRPTEVGEAPRAAVAAVLTEGPRGPEVLFIQRAEHPDDPWSGHMAFPGGRLDPGDASLEDTAMRETAEEVGLDLRTKGELLARLDDVPTYIRGLVVRPFVWVVREPPSLRPNYEVAALHWVDLGSMLRGERDTTYELEYRGAHHRFPAYAVEDRVVWGLTFTMLQSLFSQLR